jgi:quercetin dioxygenase-like cupin family protein
MQKRIARFKDLKPLADLSPNTGTMPEDLKRAAASQTVYGLTSPTGSNDRNFWDSGAVPAGTPNFGAVYVTAKPGEGVGGHVHRYSYENFIVLKGTWRIFWHSKEKEEYTELEPFDMISVPPGAMRRFECAGDTEGLLLAFAYSAEHSLTNSREATLAPPEIDRLEKMFGGQGPAYDAHFARMRQVADAVAAEETDDDRRFAREVAELVSGEVVTA